MAKPRPVTLAEAARALPALVRCERHPEWITLPLHGFKACCLLEALEAVRDNPEQAEAIAQELLRPMDGVAVLPRFRR